MTRFLAALFVLLAANVASAQFAVATQVGSAAFPLRGPDGTSAAPSYSFAASTGTGMYRSGGMLSLKTATTNAAVLDIVSTNGKNIEFFSDDTASGSQMRIFNPNTGAQLGGLEGYLSPQRLTVFTFSSFSPDAAGGATLGTTSLPWGNVFSNGAISAGAFATGSLPGTCTDGALVWDSTTTTIKVCKSNAFSSLETSYESFFSAYNSANLASATVFAQTVVNNASTLVAGSTMVHDVAGTGTGTFVAKLCSDGATCAGGNVYLTCTAGANCATAAAGRIDACTITKSAVPASTTLTWSVGTACGTADPGVNIITHLTNP